MLTILFDGIAYGLLLFILAVGLSITLGLMNFINLAHGAFAMAGGYITVVMVNRLGISFFWSLPAAFIVTALLGAFLERTLYVHLYDKSHLDQVLFSLGLIFMSVAAIDYFMGANQQIVNLPPVARRPSAIRRRQHRLLPAVRHHPLHLADDRLAARPHQDALRQPAARVRRRSARRARSRHRREQNLRADLRDRAPVLPALAARSARPSSTSIRRFR